MSEWNGYVGFEALSLTDIQRGKFVAWLKSLGERNAAPQPSDRNHWAVRPDLNAVILQAWFDSDHITLPFIIGKLAAIFDISAAIISTRLVSPPAIPNTRAAIFVVASVDRLSMAFFGYDGGDWPTLEESRAEAQLYLTAHQDEWGNVQLP